MANRYFLYQMDGDDKWIPGPAAFRDKIISDLKPAFTTALDVSSDFSEPEQNTPEFFANLTYWGDFYADFDGSLEDATRDMNLYLDNLATHGVDLNTVCLWATGGRGFHVTVAPTVFNDKERKDGTKGLPLIYREIALKLAVDTLDMAVYSTRRGRMWRTANVKRSNGLYKVPITLAEARAMTPDNYAVLCSAPRHLPPPPPPTPVPGMVQLYLSACDKLKQRLERAGKNKADRALIAKFNGKTPPTITSIMNGDNIREKVGFNGIAMQLTTAAHALNLGLDDFLAQCEGLCQKHSGNGNRYNTYSKRKAELTRLFHYTHDNPGFEFMVGPIKNLLVEGTRSLDLDGISTEAVATAAAAGEPIAPGEADTDANELELSQGLRVSKFGMHKRTEEGVKTICSVGFAHPAMLLDSITGKTIGYEVSVFCDGKSKGVHVIPIHTFAGRQKFIQYTLDQAGASMSGTDNDVGALAEVLRYRASREGKQVYIVGREGLDLVRPPGAKYGHGKYDLIYMTADPEHCDCKTGSSQQYRLKPIMTKDFEYGADLMDAPDLVDNENTRKVIDGLLNIQTEQVVARLLGWFSACWLRQVFHEIRKQFPLLHVYGESGAGKSTTTTLFGYLHTYSKPPKELLANQTTAFSLKVALSSSSSIPLILDEWKPRGDSNIGKFPQFRGILRGCHNQASTSQGMIDPGGGGTDTRKSTLSAPCCFIGEAIEVETALILRSLVTPIKVAASDSRRETYLNVEANKHVISGLGKVLMKLALGVNAEKVQAQIEEYEVEEIMPRLKVKNVNLERPIFNYAVAMVGLDLVKIALSQVFGTLYHDTLDSLKSALLEDLTVDGISVSAISEVSKVINVLAQLSNEREDIRMGLVHNSEYVVGDGYVEIKLKPAFSKYAKWTRATGAEKLFDSEEAFVAACSNYHAVVDKVCDDSPLKTGPFSVVYRFADDKLDIDKLETFKGRTNT